MMFSEPPVSIFKGVQPDAPEFARFQSSIKSLPSQPPLTNAQALEKILEDWEQFSRIIATSSLYDPREQYCLQQSWLWEIYAAAKREQIADEASRTIYNRACKVLEHTPSPARPTDLSFRTGDDLIRKMLEHLHQVAEFYQTALHTTMQRSAQMPAPTPGFQRSNVLETTDDPALAEELLQVFLGDNQYVRTILLGDATSGATIVDNCLTIPGDPIVPGRGLWIKSHTLLRKTISAWLGAVLSHDYDQVRCIFISPKGQPVSFLSKTEPLSYSTVSLKIVQAAKAGLV